MADRGACGPAVIVAAIEHAGLGIADRNRIVAGRRSGIWPIFRGAMKMASAAPQGDCSAIL